MKRLGLLIASVIACTSATQSSRLQSACSAETGAPLGTIAPDQWPLLAGTFRLIQVNNADSTMRPDAYASQLILQIADSAERARSRARRIPFQSADRQLLGTRHPSDGPGLDSAEVSDATLYIGCRDCTDASPNRLRIHRITPTGFAGSWFGGLGIGILVYSDGRKAPDPSGYFCAQRIGDPSAR